MNKKVSVNFVIKEFLLISMYCIFVGFIANVIYRHVLLINIPQIITSVRIQNVVNLIIVSGIVIILFICLIMLFGPDDIKRRIKQIF